MKPLGRKNKKFIGRKIAVEKESGQDIGYLMHLYVNDKLQTMIVYEVEVNGEGLVREAPFKHVKFIDYGEGK